MADKKENSSQAARMKKQKKVPVKDSAAPRKAAPVGGKAAPVSPQALMGLIYAVVFLLMCGMAFNSEGKVLQVLRDFFLGMFGKGAFCVAVIAPLFLAASFLHRKKKNIKFKVRCTLIFVLSFGVLYHLFVNDTTVSSGGTAAILDFYRHGILGASGGLVCGSIAYILRWAFGKLFAIIFMVLVWLLALLGAMEITIRGILQALRDLPAKPAEEEADDYNPSARFVHSVMEAGERSRARWEQWRNNHPQPELEDEYEDDEEEDVVWNNPLHRIFPGRKREETPPAAAPKEREKPQSTRDFINEVQRDIEEPVAEPVSRAPFFDESLNDEPEAPPVQPEPAVQKVTAKEAAASAKEVTEEIEKAKAAPKVAYEYPPIDLLKIPGRSSGDGSAEMKKNSVRLNETLESFKIDAHIINVTRGPSVTRYEVELDKGVRLNKLTTVADDIALSLGVASVRIAPVPGKISVVGIEVPNQIVTNVALREVIDSREFKASRSKSTFAVGKDIGGSCIVGNIAKMPHMLIAGTTGSGKSVCMNSIIISLLYKAAPDEVKLIMVDPKMVELGIYNDIPHLLIPVVTDPKKAAGSLQWAVTEMMRRYKMMSDAGVRDLESFNSIVEAEEEGEKLPQVVIIIDELADLMLVAAKEVEDSICRIAQMGRAAGMHLIIATQRPSSDVITGLMKANIPSRIAFSVASAMESRIILDTQGAEKLVGKGDMLFAPIGTGKPQRVQGCFVTDGEVEAVAGFVKEHFKANYDESVMDEIEKTAIQTGKKSSGPEPEANADEMEGDEMLPAAVDVILESSQASVSMLQRRLKLGYARAARIVDEMEEKGIVGPFQGSKPREILITKDQWEELKRKLYPGMFPDMADDPVDLPF